MARPWHRCRRQGSRICRMRRRSVAQRLRMVPAGVAFPGVPDCGVGGLVFRAGAELAHKPKSAATARINNTRCRVGSSSRRISRRGASIVRGSFLIIRTRDCRSLQLHSSAWFIPGSHIVATGVGGRWASRPEAIHDSCDPRRARIEPGPKLAESGSIFLTILDPHLELSYTQE